MGLVYLLIVALILWYLPYYAFNKAMDIQYKLLKKDNYSVEEFNKDKFYGAIAVVIIFTVVIFMIMMLLYN